MLNNLKKYISMVFIGVVIFFVFINELFPKYISEKIWLIFFLASFSYFLYLKEVRKNISDIHSRIGKQWIVLWFGNIFVLIICISNFSIISTMYDKAMYKLALIDERCCETNFVLNENVQTGIGLLPFLQYEKIGKIRYEDGAYSNYFFQPSERNNDENEIATWGTIFSWVIGVMALVISFVVSWVYLIARDAKDQVGLISGAIDLQGQLKKLRSSMLLFEVKNKISMLQHDLDGDESHQGKFLLKQISQYTVNVERILNDFSDLEKIKTELIESNLIFKRFKTESNLTQLVKDDLATIFHIQFVEYLEDLLHRLNSHSISTQAKGRACIEEVEKLWRLLR